MMKEAVTKNVTDVAKNVSEMSKGMTKSNWIYGASILSILISLFMVRRNPVLATFTGLWAPTILGMGTLFKENKILRAQGQM